MLREAVTLLRTLSEAFADASTKTGQPNQRSKSSSFVTLLATVKSTTTTVGIPIPMDHLKASFSKTS